MTLATAKLLVGRTIVAVDLRPWKDEAGTHHNPRFVLDNGAVLLFVVEETDSGDGYGVFPAYHRPRSR